MVEYGMHLCSSVLISARELFLVVKVWIGRKLLVWAYVRDRLAALRWVNWELLLWSGFGC